MHPVERLSVLLLLGEKAYEHSTDKSIHVLALANVLKRLFTLKTPPPFCADLPPDSQQILEILREDTFQRQTKPLVEMRTQEGYRIPRAFALTKHGRSCAAHLAASIPSSVQATITNAFSQVERLNGKPAQKPQRR